MLSVNQGHGVIIGTPSPLLNSIIFLGWGNKLGEKSSYENKKTELERVEWKKKYEIKTYIWCSWLAKVTE
jgi:hypothetical protein